MLLGTAAARTVCMIRIWAVRYLSMQAVTFVLFLTWCGTSLGYLGANYQKFVVFACALVRH